jgi:hypothetical protein
MRRTLAAIAVLALSLTVVLAVPAAESAAKKHCKRGHHSHKRCHKKKSSTGTAPSGGGSTAPSGPPGRLLVTNREISPTELQLQLSRPSLPAGSSIVEQYNAGSDAHDLVIQRNGLLAFAYPTLDPGGDQRQTITLTRGTYTLYCSLLNHRDLGMQATLTVN